MDEPSEAIAIRNRQKRCECESHRSPPSPPAHCGAQRTWWLSSSPSHAAAERGGRAPSPSTRTCPAFWTWCRCAVASSRGPAPPPA
eukprot:7381764-Prymnesium_polylepis.2